MRPAGWVAWALVLAAWVATTAYLIGSRPEPLCEPKANVVVRLSQPQGATEVGAIYLNFSSARQARDGLDTWLHRYGRCD